MILELQGLTRHLWLHPRVGWGRALVLGEGRARAPTGSQEFWALPGTRTHPAKLGLSLGPRLLVPWVRRRVGRLTPCHSQLPPSRIGLPASLLCAAHKTPPPFPAAGVKKGGTLSPSGVSKNSPQWGRRKGGANQATSLPGPRSPRGKCESWWREGEGGQETENRSVHRPRSDGEKKWLPVQCRTCQAGLGHWVKRLSVSG